MSQHTHDTREAVYLTDVEKLKSLHLKAKAGINQHQNLGGTKPMYLSQLNFIINIFVPLNSVFKSELFSYSPEAKED